MLSTNANAFTYPVQTIPKTVNGEEINKFTRNPNAYLKQSKNAPIPLPPNFSWLKERLPIASCFRQPMANYDKCLTKWLQHTIKKIVDVERETFKAALEPETQKEETQKETVIIQLYVDLTRLRGPGSAVVEKMIQDYAKREMLLNMKVAMDFASERNFRITVGSRWFFKHLVEYVKTEPSSTNIFREWEIGKVEDVLAKADSFGEGETEGDEAMSMDIHVDGSFGEGETEGDEEMLKKVLKTELNNAKGTIFKVTATPKENANGNKNVVELYNHRHLSRALMSGGNTTFFAIAILKLVAVFGFSLPEAIQRARSTYFFNNLLSRSVVRSFLEAEEKKNAKLSGAGKLASFDVSVFLNPDAFKKLVQKFCPYLSPPSDEQQRQPVLDDSNDGAAQLSAWKAFMKVASDTPAPENLIDPRFF